jgi:hypothetical protein
MAVGNIVQVGIALYKAVSPSATNSLITEAPFFRPYVIVYQQSLLSNVQSTSSLSMSFVTNTSEEIDDGSE